MTSTPVHCRGTGGAAESTLGVRSGRERQTPAVNHAATEVMNVDDDDVKVTFSSFDYPEDPHIR